MKIVVLAGGTSTEREISIVSGTGICKALRQKGHRAVLVDIFCGDEKVDWENPFPQEYDVDAASAYMSSFNPEIENMKKARRNFFGPNVLALCEQADVVFLGLHGANGEDGKVQAAFDLMGIKYTGTGYLSSALAMDKGITKQMFLMHDVPTPKGTSMKKAHAVREVKELGMEFPVVVKTCCGGSSVGVYIAANQAEYEKALEDAYSYEDEVVIEEYIKGREFSVAVVDGKAYPVIEIAPLQGFYDYKNKYQPGSTIETCPAELSLELTEKMQRYAEAGARALGLEGYCRLDFMMKENGDMYCLEANTLPGMTPTSLIPQEAQVLGIDYPSLCELLIEVSMKKYK
ncbi:MAG: D-alanine--D-alanine ligase [Eubacteriales bacterium]|nr:D-alanine--D-alanine ligase [Eubacteriales bacterium]